MVPGSYLHLTWSSWTTALRILATNMSKDTYSPSLHRRGTNFVQMAWTWASLLCCYGFWESLTHLEENSHKWEAPNKNELLNTTTVFWLALKNDRVPQFALLLFINCCTTFQVNNLHSHLCQHSLTMMLKSVRKIQDGRQCPTQITWCTKIAPCVASFWCFLELQAPNNAAKRPEEKDRWHSENDRVLKNRLGCWGKTTGCRKEWQGAVPRRLL